jgi:hypothetical protein
MFKNSNNNQRTTNPGNLVRKNDCSVKKAQPIKYANKGTFDKKSPFSNRLPCKK